MPDDTEENKRDRVIAAIYEVLPATTCDEIATKVSRKLRETVTRGEIYNDIYHLRRNSKEYTWSIPHVRRGIAREQDEHRYFAVPVDRDGIYVLDETPEARDHLQNGSVGTMKQTASMMLNQTNALKIAATHTRSVNARAKINDLADDFAYIARKAAAVVHELEVASLA